MRWVLYAINWSKNKTKAKNEKESFNNNDKVYLLQSDLMLQL
jgi:hypothetical protein